MNLTPGTVERHFTATAYVVAGSETLLHWHPKLRMWLPPGGHCEPNEDPLTAALREAEEETAIQVECIPLTGPLDGHDTPGVQVLPAPAVILLEDIVRDDQPFHQHIDHVYFTRPRDGLPHEVPGGVWLDALRLQRPLALPAPDGSLVPVAEDVRLLGLRAIEAGERSSRC